MLYELFIGGKKADLTEDVTIAFNYEAIDLDKPEATHGGYSKSVELPGTATNNNIFGQIYDLTRDIIEGSDSVVGSYFDPSKRTDYVLYYNGDIVDTGYLKLDSITKVGTDYTYSCTLYSNLGDFFYNLCFFQETGEAKTLADLYYGFVDEDDNYIDEDDILMSWDKDYIAESWARLDYEIEDTDRSLYSCITAAPSYSGFYDDFDNDTVLVNINNVATSTTMMNILQPMITSGATQEYYPYYGWIAVKGTRDFDEWEMRDLRSIFQRPSLKMSVLLDAISDPVNNGGYQVIWDDDIKNSVYYKKTYLILNRLDFDIDETVNSFSVLSPVGGGINIPCINNGGFKQMTLQDSNGNTTFNFANMTYPAMSLAVQSSINCVLGEKYDRLYSVFQTTSGYYMDILGGQAFRITVWKNGSMIRKSNVTLAATPSHVNRYGSAQWTEIAKADIANKLGVSPAEIRIREESILRKGENLYAWANPITFDSFDLPLEDGVEIKIETAWVFYSSRPDVTTGALGADSYGGAFIFGNNYKATSDVMVVNDKKDNTGYYDSKADPTIQKTNVNKKILFGNTETPFKYLIGFTRLLGAKYRYDLAEKKIYIDTREHYYLPEGRKVDNDIDRAKGIEIQPTLSEYKWYRYAFETPETYASSLYKRKNGQEYGELTIDTGYYFNNETHDLFEDIPYVNAVPYLQNSIYYSVYQNLPSILVSPTVDCTLYKETGEKIETTDMKIVGYSYAHDVSPLNDSAGNKICCFDNDNEIVDDLTNCLVFYDGKKQTVDNYTISDNIPIMKDLAGNPCFMWVTGNTKVLPSKDAVDTEYVCRWVNKIPVFSKYLTNSDGVYTHSLDFIRPNYTFISDDNNYSNGICIYNRYWANYIQDLYNKNNKAVTLYIFLKEKPDAAMRKFYFFDNAVWVISEITDYEASSDEPTKVKFVKVDNTLNYTNKEINWK